MSLLPKDQTLGVDKFDQEPFFWRGWFDSYRCMDGKNYQLRDELGTTFEGTPIADVCGRERAPFKLIPRYVDLSLFRTSGGEYVCHRKWVSEAFGEPPVVYDTVQAGTLELMRDALLNYDPAELAFTIWPEDQPSTARRAKRAKEWLRTRYAGRVNKLIDVGATR